MLIVSMVGVYLSVYFLSFVFLMSSSSWIGLWIAMEINLLGVLGLLKTGSSEEVGLSVKYFLIQALGSLVMLLAGLGMVSVGSYMVGKILILGLFMKMGAFPFHAWFLSVSREVGSLQFWLLSVAQKIPALWGLFMFGEIVSWVLVMVYGSLFLGLASAFSSSHMGWLLGSSSLFNLGWILYMVESPYHSLSYLCIYGISLGLLVWLKDIRCLLSDMGQGGSAMGLSFLNMGGLPPMFNMWGKFVLISWLLSIGASFGLLLFMVMSGAFVYLYVRFSYWAFLEESYGKVGGFSWEGGGALVVLGLVSLVMWGI